MTTIKEERNRLNTELEKQKEENLQKKTAIINRIKELTEAEDVNKAYTEFKQLREEWNSITPQVDSTIDLPGDVCSRSRVGDRLVVDDYLTADDDASNGGEWDEGWREG